MELPIMTASVSFILLINRFFPFILKLYIVPTKRQNKLYIYIPLNTKPIRSHREMVYYLCLHLL